MTSAGAETIVTPVFILKGTELRLITWDVAGRATLASALVQIPFTIACYFLPDASGYYGGPVPVGESSGVSFELLGGSSSFIPPLFLLNVLLTAVAFLVVVRIFGLGSLLATTFGGIAALVIGLATLFLLVNGALPFAGFPVPIVIAGPFRYEARPNHVLWWLNCILVGSILAWFRFWLLSRRRKFAADRAP